jgi:hypothetical protein
MTDSGDDCAWEVDQIDQPPRRGAFGQGRPPRPSTLQFKKVAGAGIKNKVRTQRKAAGCLHCLPCIKGSTSS